MKPSDQRLKDKKPDEDAEAPAMPFNEALKRIWSAPPMHKVKPKSAAKDAPKKRSD